MVISTVRSWFAGRAREPIATRLDPNIVKGGDYEIPMDCIRGIYASEGHTILEVANRAQTGKNFFVHFSTPPEVVSNDGVSVSLEEACHGIQIGERILNGLVYLHDYRARQAEGDPEYGGEIYKTPEGSEAHDLAPVLLRFPREEQRREATRSAEHRHGIGAVREMSKDEATQELQKLSSYGVQMKTLFKVPDTAGWGERGRQRHI
ncbi:MAG: hypothetical protein AAF549_04580 [Pseudomonadota bacterium]